MKDFLEEPNNKKTATKRDVFNTASCDIYFFISFFSIVTNSLKLIFLPNRFLLQIIGLLNNTVRLDNCVLCLCYLIS